ncbi:MAG: class I SAM-dependent methyltransferase, partial [Deltaproteobacteria bacterium]|nr:class I SAM-dependent methyltransferase [Deltaproteobacteria bacterium]
MFTKMRLVKDRFLAIEPYINGKDVLDIGCVDARQGGVRKYKSTGLHIFLKEHASFLLGVDTDEGGITAMKNEGYNVTSADAENLNLGRRFDTVVAGELIEHLSNPGLFLESVKGHLNDGGTLI